MKGRSRANPAKGKSTPARKAAVQAVATRTSTGPRQEKQLAKTSARKTSSINLLHLPEVALLTILGFLSYDEVAELRVVSKGFNLICSVHLNRGFYKLRSLSSKVLKNVKKKLPKRDSLRNDHPLGDHYNTASNIQCYTNSLFYKFNSYVRGKHLCFFMGKYLDEAYRLIRIVVKEQPFAEKYYDLTRELRDLEMMASEYFEEELEPALKKLKLPYYSFDIEEDEDTIFSISPTELLVSDTKSPTETSPASETEPEVDGETIKPEIPESDRCRSDVLEILINEVLEQNRSIKVRLEALEKEHGVKKVRIARDLATSSGSSKVGKAPAKSRSKEASPRKRKLPAVEVDKPKPSQPAQTGSGSRRRLRAHDKSGGGKSGSPAKKARTT